MPFFYFHCGTEDSALIFPYNRELAALMTEKKVPHEYLQLPGDHSWAYWNKQIQEVLKVAAKALGVRRIEALPRRKTTKAVIPTSRDTPKRLAVA